MINFSCTTGTCILYIIWCWHWHICLYLCVLNIFRNNLCRISSINRKQVKINKTQENLLVLLVVRWYDVILNDALTVGICELLVGWWNTVLAYPLWEIHISLPKKKGWYCCWYFRHLWRLHDLQWDQHPINCLNCLSGILVKTPVFHLIQRWHAFFKIHSRKLTWNLKP